MSKEITLLGALHIALSILYIVVSLAIFAVLHSKGFFRGAEASVADVICAVSACFLLTVAFIGIVGGTGVIHGKAWAHMMVLILGCLDLVSIPLGTILGIYTIYIFMKEDTTKGESSK